MSIATATQSDGARRVRDWVQLIRQQFQQTPHLCVTAEQASRLWGLEAAELDAVLSAFVDAHLLNRTLGAELICSASTPPLVMALLLGRLHVTLTWAEILRRTFVDALFTHNCLGMAAQLAYYFFFSLFPALLFLIAVASYFPITTLIDEVVGALGQFAPPEFLTIITDQIRKISGDQQGGLLTLGILTALWSSSTAMTAIIDTVNHAYGVEEGRPWWKVRLVAVALTVGGALFVLVSFALVIIGPQLAEPIGRAVGLGSILEWTWRILEWPLAFVLAGFGIALVYYFAPDVDQEWSWLAPGTMFATLLWLGASLGFRYYVINVTHYTETYGALGGAMVLLLWFYLSGFVLLLGAVMNAKIEHAAPIGKNPGEKVEGQKRRIGPAAMRRWIAARRRRNALPPSADDIRKATQ